jgi:NADPH:quinone reductase-like Zn-dependent oxidoreductase
VVDGVEKDKAASRFPASMSSDGRTPPSMKAATYDRYGPPSVIQIRNVPTPRPKRDQLLVRVRATTVTAGDWRLRSAMAPRGFGLLLRLGVGMRGPRRNILGMEFAGEVEAVGRDVKRFAPGDRVFGMAMSGANAQFIAVREGAAVAQIPPPLSFEQAAPLSFLRDKANLTKGERVLVNGASGGVGSAAVQIANYLGAEVTAVCSADNADWVRALGAARVIDYAAQDFAAGPDQYDIILDAVGNCSFRRCRNVLSPGGRLLLLSTTLAQLLGAAAWPRRSRTKVIATVAPARRQDLEVLAQLSADGFFRPKVQRTFPLDEVAQAHALVESRRKQGNVVIRVE